MNDQRALALTTTTFQEDQGRRQGDGGDDDDDNSPAVRDIHALTPPRAPPQAPRREAWETSSHRSSSLSVASTAATEGGENFPTMSREFNALVLAGSTIGGAEHESGSSNLDRIREENFYEETNPLAMVPDTSSLDPVRSPRGGDRLALTTVNSGRSGGDLSVHMVKKEEVETKISAWQNAKISKINNRFKREDAIINGWEGEQVQKASSWMKKIEVIN